MKERPILFNPAMVRAILSGRKTQTRRIIKPQLEQVLNCEWRPNYCPHGVPGDRLWAREAWRVGAWSDDTGEICVDYRADNHAREEWLRVEDEEQFDRLWIQSTDDALAAGLEAGEDGTYHWEPGKGPTRWRPSIHMPRWASRITLELTDVRVERVQDITTNDIYAEGVEGPADGSPNDVFVKFRELWDSINAKRGYGWDVNPLVWVLGFRRTED